MKNIIFLTFEQNVIFIQIKKSCYLKEKENERNILPSRYLQYILSLVVI